MTFPTCNECHTQVIKYRQAVLDLEEARAKVERLKSKLDTYENGLAYVTVDAQEAAIADATHDLREEVERLKADYDKLEDEQ